jgi:hypothetical protein
MLDAIWTVVSLPFRLLAWTLELCGRLAALVLGFGLMVVGVAFWAATLYIIGVPLFLFGLLLTLRALG